MKEARRVNSILSHYSAIYKMLTSDIPAKAVIGLTNMTVGGKLM